MRRLSSPSLLLFSLLVLVPPPVSGAALLGPEVVDFLASAGHRERLPVIVRLRERENLKRFRNPEHGIRRKRMIRALKRRARSSQQGLRPLLNAEPPERIRSIWSINAIALELTPSLIERMARHRAVDNITYDGIVELSQASSGSTAPPEWNLKMVGATELWKLGFLGQGVTVGVIDSGVDTGHDSLAASWRGRPTDWIDFVGDSVEAIDTNGHGTAVTGIVVGGAEGGTHVGAAPMAQWIAARAFDDNGQATYSDLHLALEWMLDPDGDPGTDDSPDVVNNSWGLENASGICVTEFDMDIEVLRSAGIAVVFAAGNAGPAADSSISPGNGSGAFAVGAVDSSGNIMPGSSRGPSACDNTLFPNVVAPGVSVRTTGRTILPPGYVYATGTSFATPHVAATMALLIEAFPEASLLEIEDALERSAVDVLQPGFDNDSGHGLIDARSALGRLVASRGCPSVPAAIDTDLDGVPDACDSCTETPNADQRDSDGDGFGNICDADLNGSGMVDFGDLGPFSLAFSTSDPHADFNGDGIVNFGDLSAFGLRLGRPPGPSGLAH